jgi:transcriptional regulator with XRE-family HTH domain
MSRRRTPKGQKLHPTYLRAWREFKGKTLQQVSKEALKIDPSAISRIELGRVPYDQRHLQQLEVYYGVSIPDLLYKDPLRPDPAGDLVRLVRRLDPLDIPAVTAFVEMMLARR